MSRFWRRKRQPDFSIDPDVLIKNSIAGFNQRVYEDPEFKDTLLESLRNSVTNNPSTPRNLAESTEHAAAYGDEPNRIRTADQHKIRGRAFNGIIELMVSMLDPDQDSILGATTTEDFLNGLRREIGYLASEVYHQAQIDPPEPFLNGAIARTYPGFGTLVRLEHVRGIEEQIGEITRGLVDPET